MNGNVSASGARAPDRPSAQQLANQMYQPKHSIKQQLRSRSSRSSSSFAHHAHGPRYTGARA